MNVFQKLFQKILISIKLLKFQKIHLIFLQNQIILIKKAKTTIAVALDISFNFYYQDNLKALQREGASLKFFSPVNDKKIPRCDGLYIGGGFPEVLGSKLAKNQIMKKLVKKLAEDNLPIYAECGGLDVSDKIYFF